MTHHVFRHVRHLFADSERPAEYLSLGDPSGQTPRRRLTLCVRSPKSAARRTRCRVTTGRRAAGAPWIWPEPWTRRPAGRATSSSCTTSRWGQDAAGEFVAFVTNVQRVVKGQEEPCVLGQTTSGTRSLGRAVTWRVEGRRRTIESLSEKGGSSRSSAASLTLVCRNRIMFANLTHPRFLQY